MRRFSSRSDELAMKNELVGYVLRALEKDEHEYVDGQLSKNPSLHRDMEVLRDSLEPLKADEGHIEPPDGLASRCCDEVRRQRANRPMPAPSPAADPFAQNSSSRSKWSFTDFTIAAGILIALGIVAVPTVNHSRFNAQLMGCQNNLRNLGQALHNFADASPQKSFPAIAQQKPQGFTGSYATTLVSDGYVADHTTFLCPSARPGSGNASCQLPGLVQLESSKNKSELDQVLDSGGSYAYTLGYRNGGGYHATRNQNRPTFALMADSPCPSHEYRQTSSHGSLGQNVLFEDGHVGYEENCNLIECRDDDFFHNRENQIAPGLDEDDAVVGSPRVFLQSR